jgi:pyrroline-5-carboxylate reductase
MRTKKATTFVGGGRITGALIAGLRLAGDRRRVVVYDRHPEKLKALRQESEIEIAKDLRSAISDAGILVIAVRPGSVRQAVAQIVTCGSAVPKLAVSLAAGIPIANLKRWCLSTRWARAMPSPVCRICQGFTPLTFDGSVTQTERAIIRKMFELVGPIVELPERQFDAITAAASPTHGYHALANLAEAAEKTGLSPKIALATAAHALCDGIAYWRQCGVSLDELLHEAATPGGIAAATMAAMDREGYSRSVSAGLKAGIAQARRNARKR